MWAGRDLGLWRRGGLGLPPQLDRVGVLVEGLSTAARLLVAAGDRPRKILTKTVVAFRLVVRSDGYGRGVGFLSFKSSARSITCSPLSSPLLTSIRLPSDAPRVTSRQSTSPSGFLTAT